MTQSKPVPGTIHYPPEYYSPEKEDRGVQDKLKELEARIKNLEYYMNRLVSD